MSSELKHSILKTSLTFRIQTIHKSQEVTETHYVHTGSTQLWELDG